MERLKQMKESLINTIEQQINGNLECVNTKELGEAVDMIKDLEEAIYYCTITDAMKEKGYASQDEKTYYYTERMKPMLEYPYERYDEYDKRPMTMYYDGGNRGGAQSSGGRGMSGSSSSMGGDTAYYRHDPRMNGYERPVMMPDYDTRQGRSPLSRKMYMEGKMNHKDKGSQMEELETYVQELSRDVTEMIQDASPEEKQLLQQKISTLAAKIK